MERVSKIAEKGPSNLLLAVGTAVTVVAMFWKLRPFGIQMTDLAPSEFIVAILMATVLLLAGSGLRLYQYHSENETNHQLQEVGTQMLATLTGTAIELTKGGTSKKTRDL